MKDDFVSMRKIKPIETPPVYRKRTPKRELDFLKLILESYKKSIITSNKKYDFEVICKSSEEMLLKIEDVEKKTSSHITMTKHIVESIGYIALNSINYSKQSDGKTDRLAGRILKHHIYSIFYTLLIDTSAQKIHEKGVGIVVNDVPSIPFMKNWKKMNNNT